MAYLTTELRSMKLPLPDVRLENFSKIFISNKKVISEKVESESLIREE